jgi:hypothetical protein
VAKETAAADLHVRSFCYFNRLSGTPIIVFDVICFLAADVSSRSPLFNRFEKIKM